MKLIEPTMAYEKEIRAYRQEFLACGDSMDGCGSLRELENPRDWLAQVESLKSEETLPGDWVPATQLIYVRESDNKIVGMIQIRHRFNEYLKKYGGHIGYSVAPGERRKGYAGEMLRAALPMCRALGIGDVLLCCRSTNEGSRKTIIKNGGVYESAVPTPGGNTYTERYWIHLN